MDDASRDDQLNEQWVPCVAHLLQAFDDWVDAHADKTNPSEVAEMMLRTVWTFCAQTTIGIARESRIPAERAEMLMRRVQQHILGEIAKGQRP
jgi:hypothetical protein